MTDESKPKTEKLENLELNRETVADLTESEAEQAEGGALPRTERTECNPFTCNWPCASATCPVKQ